MAVIRWPAASRNISESDILTAARLTYERRAEFGEDSLAVRWALAFRDRLWSEMQKESPLVRYQRLDAKRKELQLRLDLRPAPEDLPATRKPATRVEPETVKQAGRA